MTESLTVLLGAGFSRPAGLPLAGEIAAKFDRPLREKLIIHSSSEWEWADDKDENLLHNARAKYDFFEYPYIMEEIVKAYKVSNGGFVNYEDFFQYVKDNKTNEKWLGPIISAAEKRFYEEHKVKKDDKVTGLAFKNPQRKRYEEIITYLVGDLLWSKIEDAELKKVYQPFMNYIAKYSNVNIITLNHDTLLEHRLFTIWKKSYSDGFSVKDSIISKDGEALPEYKDAFTEQISLIKLHGTLGMYAFLHCTQNGAILTPTGKISYFKPGSYQAKHYAKRIDSKTKLVVQDYHPDIVPKFITGTNKKPLIESDYMYSRLYDRFKKAVASNNDLLIIGYSYADPHVDEELKEYSGPSVVNINPGMQYPYSAKTVSNHDSIEKLS